MILENDIYLLTCSSQCSTTGVTKAVVCVILLWDDVYKRTLLSAATTVLFICSVVLYKMSPFVTYTLVFSLSRIAESLLCMQAIAYCKRPKNQQNKNPNKTKQRKNKQQQQQTKKKTNKHTSPQKKNPKPPQQSSPPHPLHQ